MERYFFVYVEVETFFKHAVGHGFCPYVITESSFSRLLQRGSVCPICAAVVLPRHVILAFRKLSAPRDGVDRCRCARHDSVYCLIRGFDGCGEYNTVVVSKLIGNFPAFGIGDYEFSCFGYGYRVCAYLCDFIGAVESGRVVDNDFLSSLRARAQKE